MAILSEGSTCSLCGERIDLQGYFFASSAVPDESGQRCLEHSDAAIHWACLFRWPGADKFLALIHEAQRRFFPRNPYWTVLADKPPYFLAHNGKIAAVAIAGTRMYWHIQLADWPTALTSRSSDGALDVLPPSRRALAERAIRDMVAEFPSVQASPGPATA